MRLLYITVSMPFGTREAYFIPEVNELLRTGHQLLIVQRSPKGKIVTKDAFGLDRHSLRAPLFNLHILFVSVLEILRHPIRSLNAFITVFQSRNIHTLAKNMLVFPKSLWLAAICKKWRADHIHAQWGLTTSTMAMIASEVSGIPWSFTIHRGDILDNNLLRLKSLRAKFMRLISKDGIHLAAEVCGSPLRGRTVMSHLGANLPETKHNPRFMNDPPVLLCPALLTERKGHKYLIEAISELRKRGINTHLIAAGEGELLCSLRALASKLEVRASVKFAGHLDHSTLLNLYAAGKVDFVILPSLHEGIPVSLMEAMGYGIPVISTDVGGTSELLCDGAGILVPPKNHKALADATEKLIQLPHLREELSLLGRRRVEEQFAVEYTVSDFVDCIESN